MRVAILSSGLGHVFRGVESWSQEIAYELKNQGIDVTLYKGGGKICSSIEKTVFCLHRGSTLTHFLVKLMPSFAWHFGFGSEVQAEGTTFAISIIKELNKYDVIHTQEPPVAEVILLAQKLGLIHVPIIIANGTNEPVEYMKKFKYVQQLSEYYLKEARKHNNIDHQHWFSMPNFVNIDYFRPNVTSRLRIEYGIPDDAVIVLSVGLIKRHPKRIDYLINEVERLQSTFCENIFLLIAGSRSEETNELIDMARTKLKERAIFLIDQPYSKMPQIYASADIFVLCSFHETFGNVFLEAMASGLPTLGYTHPVMQWILDGGGECVDMSKDGALALALQKYLDPVYRKAAGIKAREHVSQKFSREVVVKRIIEQYHKILSEEKKA